jgi:hypothetical protein
MKRAWTEHTENLVKEWGEKAGVYRILHSRSARRYRFWSYVITIPCIAFSTIAGSLQFMVAGGQSQGGSGEVEVVGIHDQYLTLIVGIMNLIIAFMTSINQFLKLQEKAESHRVSSTSFGMYYRLISCELAFDRDSRQNADEFTLTAKKQYDSILENSPEISGTVLRKFKEEIKNKDVQSSLPDICNGLSGIKVCRAYSIMEEVERRRAISEAGIELREIQVVSQGEPSEI